MKITETGHIELTLEEFITLARLNVPSAAAGAPKGPRTPRAPKAPRSTAAPEKKRFGPPVKPRIGWHSPGECPKHKRSLVKDPSGGGWDCVKCVVEEDEDDDEDRSE